MSTHQHREPESPTVYEPADLHGRNHVGKVTSEYRVREDQCLADKLQSEEFELHFANNKNARRLGQIDLKTAKEIYLREIEESGLLTKSELNRLCKDDNLIAKDIARRIQNEEDLEIQRKAAVEMQDEEFAKYLHAKEKERLENERRRKRERQIARDREAANRLQEEYHNQGESKIVVMNNEERTGPDLYVEYNIRPSAAPPAAAALSDNTADEIMRRDEEYARKLQQLEKEKYTKEIKRLKQIARERDMEERMERENGYHNEVESVRRDVDNVALSREQFITSPGKSPYRKDSHENRPAEVHQDTNPYETIRPDASVQQKKRGSLRSVDATGQPVGRSKFYSEPQENYQSNQSERRYSNNERHSSGRNIQANDPHVHRAKGGGHERISHESNPKYYSNEPQNRHRNESSKSQEPLYLQAVDSKHSQPNAGHEKGKHFSNVAENIDPTFRKDRVEENRTQTNNFEPPVDAPTAKQANVIKNQKRSSVEGKEKKKKTGLFSKKK